MLKLIRTLRNGSSRLVLSKSPCWCISNHQIISACSSVATASQVQVTKTDVTKTDDSSNPKKKLSSISLVFNSLDIISKDVNKKNESNAIKMIQELLQIVDSGDINHERAKSTIATLRRWVENGKIKFKDFEDNPKYHKLCKILGQRSGQDANIFRISENNYNVHENTDVYELHRIERSCNDASKIPVTQAIKVLSGLASKQRRVKPLLNVLAQNIKDSKDTLSIKNIADILYSMASLNFRDELLLQKLCDDLRKSLSSVNQSSVIGSIVTSLGMLRYRNVEVLNAISKWTVEHKNILRTQDLCALVMSLAIMGFNPINSDILHRELITTLKETEMIKSSEWLDVVWALTILNKVTTEQLESVLNTRFINKLSDPDVPLVKKHKLLNINAAAKLLMDNYSGPFLPVDSQIFDAPIRRTRDKQIFVKSITDALANLFPSREHFRIDINNDTGFLLDVEFFIGQKRSPLLLDAAEKNPNALRIAVVANYYHDYCIGESNLLGSILLHYRLLKANGYRLLDISHEEFHADDKLLKRISYINERIKSIVK